MTIAQRAFLASAVLAFSFVCCPVRMAFAQDSQKTSIYSFDAVTIDGEQKSLFGYKGKALLIVNTASKCGFTSQYKSLQALYDQYKDRGLEILAFPANDFLNQEPGTNEEIKNFCFLTYQTTFPLFEKISVKGEDIHPVYAYLTTQTDFKGPISWNFNKFLVSPEGHVVARYSSPVDPLSQAVVSKIEEILP